MCAFVVSLSSSTRKADALACIATGLVLGDKVASFGCAAGAAEGSATPPTARPAASDPENADDQVEGAQAVCRLLSSFGGKKGVSALGAEGIAVDAWLEWAATHCSTGAPSAAALEELATAVSDGRIFLVGDSLSLADIVVACEFLADKGAQLSAPAPVQGYLDKLCSTDAFAGVVADLEARYQAVIASAAPQRPRKTGKAAAREAARKGKAATAAVGPAPRVRRADPSETVAQRRPEKGRENVLITSALPYVNNVPHLGNIIGCVLSADVFARYKRQRGANVMYVCGTDEYGTATETKAKEEGLTPREICTKYHHIHKGIYDWFDIAFDCFGRTSTENPREDRDWAQTVIAQDIFCKLHANGLVVEQDTQQVFCLGCDRFLADRFIEGRCPKCGYHDARGDQCDACGGLLNAVELEEPRCKADASHAVEVRSSRHMFLDLPKLSDRLLKWVEKSSVEGSWSANSIQLTHAWIRDGLKQRCITRDLKWGTPVPVAGFEDKVFYVWFDAPIGYISITAAHQPAWQEWWKQPEKDVKLYQFMGKDNIPFHTVIFPSSLLGTDEPWTLLHHVSTTEYLNYEGGKFSKSRNVGVFGDGAKVTGIEPEVWRYVLLINRPENSDALFTWDDFAARNNSELLANLGNFANRALAFTFSRFDERVPEAGALDERATKLVQQVNDHLRQYNEEMAAVRLRAALNTAMAISRLGNVFLQDSAPWVTLKTDRAAAGTTIAVAVNLVRLLSVILEPFMPGFADKICHQLAMDHGDIPDEWTFDVPANHHIRKPQPLFRPIQDEEIAEWRARFGGSEESKAAAGAAAAPAAPAAAGSTARATAAPKKGKPWVKGEKKKQVQKPPAVLRLELRVGRILSVTEHEEADKLFVETVDVGEEEPRAIVSGLRAHYRKEDLEGRLVPVLCNLKPRAFLGVASHGMLLCANNEDKSKIELLDVPEGCKPGDVISIDGMPAPEPDARLSSSKKSPWAQAQPNLRTDAHGAAVFVDGTETRLLKTPHGSLLAPSLHRALLG